jgi:hypothetical protein
VLLGLLGVQCRRWFGCEGRCPSRSPSRGAQRPLSNSPLQYRTAFRHCRLCLFQELAPCHSRPTLHCLSSESSCAIGSGPRIGTRTRGPSRGTFDTAGRSGGALRPPAGVQGAEPPCKAHQPVGKRSSCCGAAGKGTVSAKPTNLSARGQPLPKQRKCLRQWLGASDRGKDTRA